MDMLPLFSMIRKTSWKSSRPFDRRHLRRTWRTPWGRFTRILPTVRGSCDVNLAGPTGLYRIYPVADLAYRPRIPFVFAPDMSGKPRSSAMPPFRSWKAAWRYAGAGILFVKAPGTGPSSVEFATARVQAFMPPFTPGVTLVTIERLCRRVIMSRLAAAGSPAIGLDPGSLSSTQVIDDLSDRARLRDLIVARNDAASPCPEACPARWCWRTPCRRHCNQCPRKHQPALPSEWPAGGPPPSSMLVGGRGDRNFLRGRADRRRTLSIAWPSTYGPPHPHVSKPR